MKILTLTLLLIAFPLIVLGADADSLTLNIKLVKGERSRDSSSTTKSISVVGDAIKYDVTHGGRNRGRLAEQHKEFRLESADRQQLIKLIHAGNLLITASIERDAEVKGNSYYFTLSVKADVNGSEGNIIIKGSRKDSDLKELQQYKDASALIEAIFEIMRRTDKEIIYEKLIR